MLGRAQPAPPQDRWFKKRISRVKSRPFSLLKRDAACVFAQKSGMRGASLAETSPFYIPGPSSGRVLALVLLSQQKFRSGRRKNLLLQQQQQQQQQQQGVIPSFFTIVIIP